METMEYIPCDKSKPYVFISYKREDAELVKSDIAIFQHKYGVNIWCDKELEHVGSERWQDEALKAIQKARCKLLLLYASAKALASKNVQAEIAEAKQMGVEILIVNFIDKHFEDFLKQALRDDDIVDNIGDIYNMRQAIDYLDDLLVKDRTFYSRKDPNFYNLVLGVIKNKEDLSGVIIRDDVGGDAKIPLELKPESVTVPEHRVFEREKDNETSALYSEKREDTSALTGCKRSKVSADIEEGRKRVNDWFWEYAENGDGKDIIRNVPDYKPPSKGYGNYVAFTTVNLERAFKLVGGMSSNPPDTPNISVVYKVGAKNKVKVEISCNSQDASDDEKSFIRKELEAAFARINRPLPNPGFFNVWFSQKLVEGKNVEAITKEDFLKMLDIFKELDTKLFG
ncbi:MAG: toll/interleukin-1 receptor domain-containing protein [Oscillospiraceae bacterium]|nr:toll/interleukin-1 receptor domain-containing protein [Oscillospiraceae bacterium]